MPPLLAEIFLSTPLWGEIAFAAVITAVIYVLDRRYPARTLLGSFRVSRHGIALYILAAMLGPLVLRLGLLPWIPPPEPTFHDEFGHLLVADTLLAGRLANPPHPLWHHLETIYVLQQPAYASKYPIGQGVILAIGQGLTGHPWAGVLLAMMLMCGGTTWMLFGCLPPRWAAIGGMLAAFGLAPHWTDSYFGGAFCAFGGALLFGALCRLRQLPSSGMGLIAGLGWSIVWLTRPFESLLLLLFSCGFIVVFMIQRPKLWRTWLRPIVWALSVLFSTGVLTALHNHAVTGSFTTTPYQLSQQVYGVPQSFLWQRPINEPVLPFKELKDMYWWQRNTRDSVSDHILRHYGHILHLTWSFFVTPWYSLPIVLLLLVWKDREVFVCSVMVTAAVTASVLYPFFFPHYVAAYFCVIVFLIMRGMMVLSQWSFRGKAVGRLVALFLMIGGFAMALRIVPVGSIPAVIVGRGHRVGFRERIKGRLMGLGGRHIVFVRYGATHGFQMEWVYNAADIDGSPIVWCRTMRPADDVEVTRYYKDRQAWVVDVNGDEEGDVVRVSRYQPGISGPGGVSPMSPGIESLSWVLENQPPGKHW